MLRALFNREELVKALELVGHVVPKRSPKPILACVRIESMNGMVKIGGTDLETAILVDFHTVQVEQDGLALLNLRDFLATLKASTSDVVKLEPHTGEFGPVWRIADEDAESTIAMEKCADYPPMPGRASGPLAGSFKVNRDHLSEAIGCVTWSAARPGGSNRFAYESICFSLANGRACLVTTNSRTMAVADLGGVGEASFAVKEIDGQGDFVIPVRLGKLLTAAGKYAAGEADDWFASFAIERCESASKKVDNLIARFAIGPVTVYYTVADIAERPFPPYRDILTSLDERQIITASSEEFLAAVKKCALVTDQYAPAIALDVDSKGVRLSASTYEGRATRVNFSCRVIGGPVRFGLNPDQLTAAIKAGKSEEFTLSGSAPNRPWKISNGNGYRAVIMPVNLTEQKPAAVPAAKTQEPVPAATAA